MILKIFCFLLLPLIATGYEKQGERQQTTLQKQSIQKRVPLQTQNWKRLISAEGRFQVDVPDGWIIRQKPEENPVVLTPEDKEVPEIAIIGGLDAVIANYFLTSNYDFNLSGTKYTAAQFLQKFFFPLLRTGDPNMKVDALKASSDTNAEAVITATYKGFPVKIKIVCQMEYLVDPTVSFGQTSWYSFAFITTVTASPSELDNIEKIAVHVFRSFKPNEKWLKEIKEAVINGINTRLQMIGRTISRINRMEIEQRMAEMKSTYDSSVGWIHALGGTTEVIDTDSGSIYIVDDKYKYYYEEAGRVYGTDDSGELNLPGRRILKQR